MHSYVAVVTTGGAPLGLLQPPRLAVVDSLKTKPRLKALKPLLQ